MDRRHYLQSLGGVTALGAGSGIGSANTGWFWGPTVDTESGTVEGESAGETNVFKGIPYAHQPVGERRWRPPKTPAPTWDGTRDATEYGPLAPQSGLLGSIGSIVGLNTTTVDGKEDGCLNLNVWAPEHADPGEKPVMVWIHGGGYEVGSNRYDSQNLSERGDVVVVTINYRLGPLGFFTHPDLLAEDPRNVNQGYQDMVAALEWVQRNVAAFGGDPDNVTIFGESAGGNAVLTLLTDPSAEGLFHRAICESGPVVEALQSAEDAAADGTAVAGEIGCTGSEALSCLRDASTKDLLATGGGGLIGAIAGGGDEESSLEADPLGVTVDGTVIEKNPALRFRDGEFHDVPLITGGNADETQLFLLGTDVPSAQAYEETIRSRYPDRADEVLAAYPVSDYETPKKALIDVTTDETFLCGDRLVSKWITDNGGSVYRYIFDDAPSDPFLLLRLVMDGMGAYHAAEMAYVFGQDIEQRGFTITGLGRSDRKLSRIMQDYWTSFARSGEPGGTDRQRWPDFDSEFQNQFRFTEDGAVTQVGEPSACAIWERLYRDRLGL